MEVDKVRQRRVGLIVADGAQAVRYVYEELGGLYAERWVATNWPSVQMTVIFSGCTRVRWKWSCAPEGLWSKRSDRWDQTPDANVHGLLMQGQVSTIFTASDGREYVIGPDRQVRTVPACGRRGGRFDAGEHRCDILATFSGQDPIVLELKVRKPTKSDRVQAGAPLRQLQRGANASAVEKVHGRSQARAQVWSGGCAFVQGSDSAMPDPLQVQWYTCWRTKQALCGRTGRRISECAGNI